MTRSLRSGVSKRRLAAGAAFVGAFAIGLAAALVLVAPAGAQQGETTALTVSTDTTATVTTGSGGIATGAADHGSTVLFAVLVLGLAVFFATPYLFDVIWTHRRWDHLLDAARAKQGGLTADDLREFAERSPTGIDGLARSLMAFSVIGVLGAGLFYVLVKTPTPNSGAIISNLLATLGTLATAIIAFYFGARVGQSGSGTGGNGTTTTPPATTTGAPANTTPPTIEGSPVAAGVLTATPGAWTVQPDSLDYQWQREDDAGVWTTIANGPTYQLGPDDSGHRVRVVVTATNLAGTSDAAASEPLLAS